MYISAIGNYYNNVNSKYCKQTEQTEQTIKTEPNKPDEVYFSFGQSKILSSGKLKAAMMVIMLAATTLIATNCTKEKPGPQQNGYEYPEEPVVSHDGYPEDAPEELMAEFRVWYQDNCPYYYWPDYTDSYPAGWEQEVQAFQEAILEWWHSHGYPDWHP